MGAIGNGELRGTREERQRSEEAYDEGAAARRRAKQIRDHSLFRITNQLITKSATEEDIHFIFSELNVWKRMLLQMDPSLTSQFIDNQLSFPKEIRDVLNPLLPVLQLKLQLSLFTFAEGVVNRAELRRLFSLVQDAFFLLTDNPDIETERPSVLFVTKLREFLDNTRNDALDEKETLCLHRIMNDYQSSLLGVRNLISDLIATTLMASTKLSQLNLKCERMSFLKTMDKYFKQEYLPYAEILMTHGGRVPVTELVLADPIIDFIMARHRDEACRKDATYAPEGTVTLTGVKKYLANIHHLVSQRDCERALEKSREIRGSLETSAHSFWTSSSRQKMMQIKIDALTELERRITEDGELPDVAAIAVKMQYPGALYSGFFSNSRTDALLKQLERGITPKLS